VCEETKLRRRCLFLAYRHTYQRPIDPINLIQNSAAFMKQLQRISAQALYIGNGCADLLNSNLPSLSKPPARTSRSSVFTWPICRAIVSRMIAS